MTHKELLANNPNELAECAGDVELFQPRTFWDDVYWGFLPNPPKR
jgi:hypothetical protein